MARSAFWWKTAEVELSGQRVRHPRPALLRIGKREAGSINARRISTSRLRSTPRTRPYCADLRTLTFVRSCHKRRDLLLPAPGGAFVGTMNAARNDKGDTDLA
jgi:hypothetical protein